MNTKEVFVIHGRNEEIRKSLFSFLRSIGLKPLEWNQLLSFTGESSPHISTVLDVAFDRAPAVVVLLTGDDEVKLVNELIPKDDPNHEKTPSLQPRPNVLFEAGMSMGRDPKRTVLVQVGQMKNWSDIGGRHVTRLDNTPEKRLELISKLKTAGCDVDDSGKDWVKTGDFTIQSVVKKTSSRESSVASSTVAPISKNLDNRVLQIFRLLEVAEDDEDGEIYFKAINGSTNESIFLPSDEDENDFTLYFLFPDTKHEAISEYWYVATLPDSPIDSLLAQIRVLLKDLSVLYQYEPDAILKFIIITDKDYTSEKDSIQNKFDKIKSISKIPGKDYTFLEIWDDDYILEKERELGLIVE